jgi:predicted DNA-binding protein (MmcQ/YjbR family)
LLVSRMRTATPGGSQLSSALSEAAMAHPRMYDDNHPTIKKLREVCLALGDVVEKEAWGECTFRAVDGSMFAMTDNNHHESGHVAVWVKAPAMAQEILINSNPESFFRPPYMGHKGWVGVRIDRRVDWKQLAGILRDGYEMSLPQKKTGSKPKRPVAIPRKKVGVR